MEWRKWEDLQKDCLVKVFEKVGIKALTSDVSLVCKPWYKISLDPQCWKYLDFPIVTREKCIEFIADRSCGAAIRVEFPRVCFLKEFIHISEGCPALKSATLPDSICGDKNESTIAKQICQWKHLEFLNLSAEFYFVEIIAQVSIHCKNLVGLVVSRSIQTEHASAIVNSLPKIRSLKLEEWANISPESLVLILAGCKELEEVDVSNCFGFDSGDESILKEASHIKTFKAEGSKCRNEMLDSMFDVDIDAEDIAEIAASIAEI